MLSSRRREKGVCFMSSQDLFSRLDHDIPSEGMHLIASGQRDVFFSNGFRPFFLSAALFASVAVPVWIAIGIVAEGSDTLAAARVWHTHEMVFGFLSAVITGFLLTAMPNWTDRPVMRGKVLLGLWLLWLIGRLGMATPWIPHGVSAGIDAAFLVVVAGLVLRELACSRSWPHAPIGGLIALYAGANIAFHVLTFTDHTADVAWRLGIGLIVMLITVIGGRITPTFTGEWMSQRGWDRAPAAGSLFDGISVALVVIAAVAWTVQPDHLVTGWLLVAAGMINVVRLVRWYGWLTWPEPLVLLLHVGYGWLALSLVLWGGAILGLGVPMTDALHAFTTGAVGSMTLAVMTRASLGHTGRMRQADRMTVLIYMLVNLAALLRVFGPATGLPESFVLSVAALCWSGAYLLFSGIYGPYLLAPSLDGE